MRSNATSSEIIGAVRELISLMGKGGITELDLSTGDVSIRLRGSSASTLVASGFSLPLTPVTGRRRQKTPVTWSPRR